MSEATIVSSSARRVAFGALWLAALLLAPRVSQAEAARERLRPTAAASADGVYGRFDGDLDLGFALGAEFGSAGDAAPALRASAHYFSIAGVYASGRIKASDQSAPSLFGLGVDLRPLFVPRWVKGYQTGSARFDLSLDSLSLSLGAFWAQRVAPAPTRV